MTPARFKNIISKFKNVRVLVIGDLILDEFVWGGVTRISPEAPVPVVRVKDRSFMPGGALNVTHNIRALGGQVTPCGVVGKDNRGARLKGLLRSRRIKTNAIVTDPGRPTTLKTRVIAHQQQVVRIDEESDAGLNGRIRKNLLIAIRKAIRNVDCVIIEDYGKGVVDPGLIREVVALARKNKCIISVDPKEEHSEYYQGVTVLTPNLSELETMVGYKVKTQQTLKKAGHEFLKHQRAEALLVTRGDEGMSLFEKSGKVTHIPTTAREVYDVSGAGDTVIGVFTLALACGAKHHEAAVLSNRAAGLVVGKVGVAVVTPKELVSEVG